MKKMLLRSISLFLVLLMIYSSVPVSVFAIGDLTETQTELVTGEETIESQTEGEETEEPIGEEIPEYSYTVNEDNTLVITSYNGKDAVVKIPETIEDKIVKIIGSGAFANNENILDVTIPDSVTTIENEAFSNCNQLVHIISISS